MSFLKAETVGQKQRKKTKAKKKVRYRRYSFSLSEKESKKITLLSKSQNTTVNKLLKKAVREYVKTHHVNKRGGEQVENQLSLFEPKEPYQLTMNLDD